MAISLPTVNILSVYLMITVLITLKVNGQNNSNPECDDTTCPPTDCYCATTRIPNDLEPQNIPQMVLVSFNGRVTFDHREYIDQIFSRRRKNPNGTPIRMTLFVSDDRDKTDYCTVSRLWSAAHEIASFSLTRKTPQSYWVTASEEEWSDEINGLREKLVEEAEIPEIDIRGFRSPHLQPGGNTQYNFAVDQGYVFDSSIVTSATYNKDRPLALWPYTMDLPSGLDCYTEPCPDDKFPGLWQFPVQPLFDSRNRPCFYLDSCRSPPRSADEVYNILMRSFNHSYYNNRAPLMINFMDYKEWFDDNGDWPIEGINRFIDEVLDFEADDVFFITYSDLIGWMDSPTELRLIRYFPAFGRIQKETKECDETIDQRPFVNGVALVVIETVIFVVAYVYFYIKEKQ